MRLHFGFDDMPCGVRSVVTVGSFDGVHAGHRLLISHLEAMASRLDAESVVVTFDPHPRIAMGRAEGMQLLTTIDERASLLASMGVDHLVVARFDDAFRAQSYESFVRDMLVVKLGMVGMIVGYNHRLGRGSEGNHERLVPIARECGFDLECVAQHTDDGDKISSTVIRGVIAEGDMSRASQLLGACYSVIAEACDGVVTVVDEYKMLPPDGEYVAVVHTSRTATEEHVVIKNRRITLGSAYSGGVTILFK